MKKIIFSLAAALVCTCSVAYAQETQDIPDSQGTPVVSATQAVVKSPEVEKFYSDYVKEVKEEVSQASHWQFAGGVRVGSATYRETKDDLDSKSTVVLPELYLQAKNRTANKIEHQIDVSWGQSNSSKEHWEVGGLEVQTNKMNFSRFNVKGSIGKVLATEHLPGLDVIPFIGYGFRLIDFERSDFTIFSLPVEGGKVSEQYYLQHGDLGLKLAKKLNEEFTISGMATYGYVFYNVAHNSELGTVRGTDGRFIIDGNIVLQYSLGEKLKLDLGGFIELQEINGGQSDIAIWPDNKLSMFGGQAALRYVF